MKSGAHMNRLLQGDVGSGKTVIASLAMYGAYTAGLQSALMVPTEILAEQHYQSLQGLFPELEVVLLTSGMKAADKKVALSKIESGEAQMIVGTHSLIQDAVTYHRLGLVITDEQHRFGVNQRRIFRFFHRQQGLWCSPRPWSCLHLSWDLHRSGRVPDRSEYSSFCSSGLLPLLL